MPSHFDVGNYAEMPPLEDLVPAWQSEANCRGMDPELFFPERGQSVAHIHAVCDGCKVRSECLEYALEHRLTIGWWGGVSERGRRRMARERRAA